MASNRCGRARDGATDWIAPVAPSLRDPCGQYEKGMNRIHAPLATIFPGHRTARDSIAPLIVGGVSGDGASIGPRQAGAELGVLSLLRGVEKHIPMIDGAVDFENPQGAKASQQAARSGVSSPAPVSEASAARGRASCRTTPASRCWRPRPRRYRHGSRPRCRSGR